MAEPRILVLDAASGPCLVALLAGNAVIASREWGSTPARGDSALLASKTEAVLAEAGIEISDLAFIAVTLGPGSFTGIRAALSLAYGLALGGDVPLVGVTVGEALAAAEPDIGRPLWIAIDSRRAGRIFLERDGVLIGLAATDLPQPAGPVALAGSAAPLAAAVLAARGSNVKLCAARLPDAVAIAAAAARRVAGELPPRPPLPVYVDPPEAKPPAGGLRPAPV